MALPEGKVFNAETMTIEDAPQKQADQTTNAKQESETPDDKMKEEEEQADDKKEEGQEEEEEQQEEKKEGEDEEQQEEKKEEEVEDTVGIDDYIRDRYAEKFGVEDELSLDSKLEEYGAMAEELEELRNKVKDLETAGANPVFTSEQEKKAFEFLKEFDVTRMGEGMQTIARIVTMDIASADPRVALEEKFIIEHPELTREESLLLFNRDYKKKYEIRRDDYDTEEAYNEEAKLLEIAKKTAVRKAKDFLAAKQVDFKAEAKKGQQKPEANPVIDKSINEVVSEVDSYMKEFQSITYQPTESKNDNFTIKFTPEQVKTMHKTLKDWVSNRSTYDANGEIVGGFDIDEKVAQVAHLLYGEDMMAKMYAHVMNQADIKRAEQIATKKPTREAKTAVDKVNGGTEEQQWDRMIKQKKADRAKQPPVYR